jgi:hypothetical protein
MRLPELVMSRRRERGHRFSDRIPVPAGIVVSGGGRRCA